jgi:hypothetical protein
LWILILEVSIFRSPVESGDHYCSTADPQHLR